MGIEYDIIPTEEAWRLGKIGKRNALMRTLAERLIDQNAALERSSWKKFWWQFLSHSTLRHIPEVGALSKQFLAESQDLWEI